MKNKTQKQLVMEFVAENGNSTIDEVHNAIGILRPNIRRILGQGAKQQIFERVAPGVYILKTEQGTVAYVEVGDAITSLPKLRAEGWKFDAVFIDPPYFSKSLIGGNRGIVDYDFIFARQFSTVMENIAAMVQNENTHVYLMLSGAKTAQKEMKNYVRAVNYAGFKLCKEGKYKKLYKDGKAATNVRGEEASAERLLLFTLSGNSINNATNLKLDFALVRPNGYQTEKPGELLKEIISQSTDKGGTILDPFAGSGVTGEEALKAGRNCYLIEKNRMIVEQLILNRISNGRN